jgi:hypothetical protein
MKTEGFAEAFEANVLRNTEAILAEPSVRGLVEVMSRCVDMGGYEPIPDGTVALSAIIPIVRRTPLAKPFAAPEIVQNLHNRADSDGSNHRDAFVGFYRKHHLWPLVRPSAANQGSYLHGWIMPLGQTEGYHLLVNKYGDHDYMKSSERLKLVERLVAQLGAVKACVVCEGEDLIDVRRKTSVKHAVLQSAALNRW